MTDSAKSEAPLVIRGQNMQELIERLEKAKEPDHTIHGLIAVAAGKAHMVNPKNAEFADMIDPMYPDFPPGPPYSMAPNYTGSIDAALTLVPEGCVWALNFASMATILKPADDPVMGILWGKTLGQWPENQDEADRHVTPAIALCIAALKARAALSNESKDHQR